MKLLQEDRVHFFKHSVRAILYRKGQKL